jgi:endonuclease YncB( thermonuclease family)
MRVIAACIFLLSLSTAAVTAAEAIVHDGDTLTSDGTIYRLDGIDAPELDQNCTDKEGTTIRCGIIARDRLIDFIGKRPVVCDDKGPDKSYKNTNRRVGECRVEGEALTLNEWLVRQGLAFNFEPYARGRFMPAQNDAQANHRGFWPGCFVMPQDFRRGNEHTAILHGESCEEKNRNVLFDIGDHPPGCAIKAKFRNIPGYRGIYHVEGCRSYQRLKSVDRWFCTEEEARAEHFRKALNCPKL